MGVFILFVTVLVLLFLLAGYSDVDSTCPYYEDMGIFCAGRCNKNGDVCTCEEKRCCLVRHDFK